MSGKRAKGFMAVSLVTLTAGFGTGAQAQTTEELMDMIRQLSQRVEQLEGRLQQTQTTAQQTTAQQATIKANAAADQAQAAAETASTAKGSGMNVKWGPSPTFASDDGRFEMHVRGRLYMDFGDVSDNLGEQDRFATELRTARLGIEGKAWGDVKYKIETDFAGNDVALKDALIQYQGWKPLTVTVGHFKEWISLEEQTSSRHIAFMERAAITDAFGVQRRLGLGLDYHSGDFYIKTALYGGGDISDNTDDEGYAVVVRTFWTPKVGNGGQLHVGGSLRHRDLNNDIDGIEVRYRQRPFAHVSGERYVNTDHLPGIKDDLFYGFELAGAFGPFWASGEYGTIKASVLDGSEALFNGENSLSFDGGYFDVGWFITGESRPLKKGGWNRPKVNNPVFEGGMGALAVTARFDFLNLNDMDAGVYGGKQRSFIFGVNWYLNRHTRVLLNYARTEVEKGFDAAMLHGDALVDPVTGKANIDAITGRFQVDW